MLYVPGPISATFESYLDRLDAQGKAETTKNGFDYCVVDGSLLEIPSGVVGTTKTTEDAIEIRLILGSEIPEIVRPTIADICITMASLGSEGNTSVEGLVCQATQQVLRDTSSTELRVATGRTLQATMNGYKAVVAKLDQARHYRDTSPIARMQLKHTLGMTAMMRPPEPCGQEVLELLFARNLNIPAAESGQVLHGQFHTKNQGSFGASIYCAVERGNRHSCKTCSGQIFSGDTRISLSLDKKTNGYDHHHYHPVCFTESDLTRLDLGTARPEQLPPEIAPHYLPRKT